MKKLLLIIFLLVSAYFAQAQNVRGYTVYGQISVTTDSLLIINGDTIGHFHTIGTDTIVDKSYVDALFQEIPGGHAAVTLGTSAVNGGMTLSGQELSMGQASSSTSGWISATNWQTFNSKLSFVSHDGTLSGNGTSISPLSVDGSVVALRTWVTSNFVNGNQLDYDSLINKPTIPVISNIAYDETWHENLDGASKNSIYNIIQTLGSTGTDLTYNSSSTQGEVASSTGNNATIPAGSSIYASLMLPEDKIKLNSIAAGTDIIDTIYTETDELFPIDYLNYVIGDDTVYVVDIPKPRGILSGGIVNLQSGLTFSVSPAAYYINGVLSTTVSSTVSLDTADATYSRTDVIAVDNQGDVVVITGIPAANPLEPSIDPETQIKLTSVLLLSNATTPVTGGGDTIQSVVVYNENTEWTPAAVNCTADFSHSGLAYNGSISAIVGTFEVGDYIKFTNASSVSVSNFTSLSFWLLLNGTSNRRTLTVQFFNSGSAVSNVVNTSVNFKSLVWQNVAIPFNEISFNAGATQFDEIRISITGGSISGYYIDYVVLQGGISTPVYTTTTTLTGDITGSGIGTINTTIVPNIISSIDGVINNKGNIDLVQGGIVTITPNDGANTITIAAQPDTTNVTGLLEYINNVIDTTNLTANHVTVTDTGNYFDGTDVESILQEIGQDIATSGDNWGSQVVVSNATLNGSGVTGDSLAVNTSIIATVESVNTKQNTLVSGTNIKTINSETLLGSGNIVIEGNATHTGEVTGNDTLFISDNVINYAKVDSTLKGAITDNDGTWDYSAAGIIYAAISSNTNVSLNNLELNKTLKVKLTLSSGAVITWPDSVVVAEGSAELADGTFYIYMDCWNASSGTEEVLISIIK